MKKIIIYILLIFGMVSLACGTSSGNGFGGKSSEGKNTLPELEGSDSSQFSSACNGDEVHEFAEGIAETYEIPYENVMTWFCNGFSFQDIMFALETSELAESTPDELLDLRDQGQSWDEILTDLGLYE